MADLICMGEMLIDFTPQKGTMSFTQNPGGAPANVAVQAARLGITSGFMGKVGDDMFGRFLQGVLKENNVDTTNFLLDKEYATTLAFVHLSESGDRDFSFYRNPGADTMLDCGEIDLDNLSKAKVLCFGSLLLTNQPSRSAVNLAVDFARDSGIICAYDPNWRPPLWKNKQDGIAMMKSLVPKADIIKVSDEELELLTDCKDLRDGASQLIESGVTIVVCTMGAKGCIVFTKDDTLTCPTYDVNVKDTTGSGDSFFGTFLAGVIELGKKPGELSPGELRELADLANAAGSACAGKQGAIPALPNREEIAEVMKKFPLLK